MQTLHFIQQVQGYRAISLSRSVQEASAFQISQIPNTKVPHTPLPAPHNTMAWNGSWAKDDRFEPGGVYSVYGPWQSSLPLEPDWGAWHSNPGPSTTNTNPFRDEYQPTAYDLAPYDPRTMESARGYNPVARNVWYGDWHGGNKYWDPRWDDGSGWF